jgi:hypothetical protein
MPYSYQSTIDAINQLSEEYNLAGLEEIYDNIISEGDGTYHQEFADTELDMYVSGNTIEQNLSIIHANGSVFEAIQVNIEEYGEGNLDMRNEARFTAQLAYLLIRLAITDHDTSYVPKKQIEYGVDVSSETLCSICLTDNSESDERNSEWARTTVCNHYFHKACIDLWARNCPNCRSEI